MPPFVHLHCHTHYSLLDGASRIPELVQHVKGLGMNAVAITDHGNLYGAIEFYRECKAGGINPILGYEAYVALGPRTARESRRSDSESDDSIEKTRQRNNHHLTLLAKNSIGFKNLIKMSSLAFLEGYHYKPRIDKELLERHSEGVICLSGCAAAEFSDHILNDRKDEAKKTAEWFASVFKDRFYIEIQNNGLEIQRLCAEGAIDIANQLGLPLVATSDAHYLRQDDHVAHDVLLCINTGKPRSHPKRFKFENNQFHVRGPEEMYALFPGHAEAVKRSQEIADGVHIDLDFKKRHFPVFSPPRALTPNDYLRELCAAGLQERYRGNPSQAARERLEHELGIICRMGFASYFLIVWDFVRFAHEQGIPASARGSACGALVSYVLKLSHVDPLEYDLLFERFLDPNRAEAPDIDIDFCQNRREEVIAYVKQKYGEASVAQIATFGTMAAKAALKDVGRALDIPLERVNQLTAMIPKTLGVTLDEALKQSPEFQEAYRTDTLAREMIDIARTLEGTNRQTGIHAAGVVIANGPLTDYVPVHRAVRKSEEGGRGGEPAVATQWVMGDLEKVGMLKMDFLGLRTLTLLKNAVVLIEQSRGFKIDLYNLPPDDPETYALLQKGDAKGVFQLESEGIRTLLAQMRPDNIRDIVAIMALYRPGPLQGGMVDSYVNCKHGREQPVYQHPVMEEVLAETYGVMCIHEDVRVSLADGTEKPIKEVRMGDRVHSLNRETNTFEIKECHGCGSTRRGDGLCITLENGFSVTVTEDHEVLTYHGMKQAQELNLESDLVAVGLLLKAEESPTEAIAPWLGTDEDVAYLFGQLVGDGCLTSSGITLATGVEVNHQKLTAWIGERFPVLRLSPYYHQRSWYLTLSCPELLNQPGHGNRKTRFHHLIATHGLKCKSTQKEVPEIILRSRPSVRAAFLAGLLDSDGCLAKTDSGSAVAFLTSSSPRLLQGVRRLCQLEGIAVQLRSNRLQVWNLLKLREIVGTYIVLKQFVGKLTDGDSVGWIPRSEVFAAIPAGESLRAFSRRTGLERRGLAHDFPFVKSSTARKAGICLGDVRYYRIRSVIRVQDQQFYGMSVADHHNLVANGIVVKNCYQEQIMRILNRLGGIELPSAYACIKAISKKKQDVIDERFAEFQRGAQERGLDKKVILDIWNKIIVFAGYGFNKSHSAAYAQVGYQTAYLKAHFPAEFMAALLSSEIDDGNKRDIMVEHIADARRLGSEVLPPDINASAADFTVVKGKILFGLTAIKGLGRGAADEIVRARAAGGAFKDLFDFCDRLDTKIVSKAALERLVKAGGFDRFGHRAQILQVMPRALQSASMTQRDRKVGQMSLFGGGGDNGSTPDTPADVSLPDVTEWTETEKLKFEKEALDFYFSSHPLAQHESVLRMFSMRRIAEIVQLQPGQEVILGGMLTNVRFKNLDKPGRNGNSRYVRLNIEDLTGSVECVMWPDDLARQTLDIQEEVVCFVRGAIDPKSSREKPLLLLTRVLSMEQAQRELTRAMVIQLTIGVHAEAAIDHIGRVLKRTPGPCPVSLRIRDQSGKFAQLKLSADYGINPGTVAVGELEALLGEGTVKFWAPAGNGNGNARNGR